MVDPVFFKKPTPSLFLHNLKLTMNSETFLFTLYIMIKWKIQDSSTNSTFVKIPENPYEIKEDLICGDLHQLLMPFLVTLPTFQYCQYRIIFVNQCTLAQVAVSQPVQRFHSYHYLPPTKLREGNVFTGACLFTHDALDLTVQTCSLEDTSLPE